MADVVVLKSGDRITGSIVKKDGPDLVIKSNAAGAITIPWDQVDSLTTDGPVTVVTTGDRTVQSQITTAGGRLVVGGTQVATGDIVAIRNADEQNAFERLQHPGWGQLWTGAGSLNFAGTTGNSETRSLVVNVNAARTTRTDETSLYFTAIDSSATVNNLNSQTAQAVRGGWAYKRDLRPRVFLKVFNDWEYNKFQDLDLRFVIGAGVGYHVWKSKKGFLDFSLGADYARDKFGALPPVPPATLGTLALTDSRGEFFYSDTFSYKLTARTSFTQSWGMFHDFSDFGNYRLNFDAAANTQLTKWLIWTLSLSDRYLATVPVVGYKNNDFVYATGIGVTFAR